VNPGPTLILSEDIGIVVAIRRTLLPDLLNSFVREAHSDLPFGLRRSSSLQKKVLLYTCAVEFSRFLELQPSQTMKCTVNGRGVLVYTAVEQKPVTDRLTYQKWLEIVARLTPPTWPGKTYTQICREGGIGLRSAPVVWVREAEHDIGLKRTMDTKTHRVLWTRQLNAKDHTPRKLRDAKLAELV
jgi:hypothetical protein